MTRNDHTTAVQARNGVKDAPDGVEDVLAGTDLEVSADNGFEVKLSPKTGGEAFWVPKNPDTEDLPPRYQ